MREQKNKKWRKLPDENNWIWSTYSPTKKGIELVLITQENFELTLEWEMIKYILKMFWKFCVVSEFLQLKEIEISYFNLEERKKKKTNLRTRQLLFIAKNCIGRKWNILVNVGLTLNK